MFCANCPEQATRTIRQLPGATPWGNSLGQLPGSKKLTSISLRGPPPKRVAVDTSGFPHHRRWGSKNLTSISLRGPPPKRVAVDNSEDHDRSLQFALVSVLILLPALLHSPKGVLQSWQLPRASLPHLSKRSRSLALGNKEQSNEGPGTL
jgi:hypothetical protein